MIEILCLKGGVYFPVFKLDVEQLNRQGFSNQFMLQYTGQSDQLYATPSGCLRSTPQVDAPEHDLNCATGGSPALKDRSVVENVTVFFATGQSNVVSDIAAPLYG